MATSRIALLCASHLSSIERLGFLLDMLDSYKDQTYKTRLYLSISLPRNMSSLKGLISNLEVEYPGLKVLYQEEKKSQFEHFQLAAQEVEEEWILFVDDDDLMHPQRCEKYASKLNLGTDIVRIGNYVDGKNYENIELIEEVNYLAEKKKLVEKFDHDRGENFVEYCFKSLLLRDFISRSSPSLLQNRFCDCFFMKYLLFNQETITSIIFHNSPCWIYFYRRHHMIQQSSTLLFHPDLQKELDRIARKYNLYQIFVYRFCNNIEHFCARTVNYTFSNFDKKGEYKEFDFLFDEIMKIPYMKVLRETPLMQYS